MTESDGGLLQSRIRTLGSMLALWSLGLLAAVWLGLGWFFLAETIRRLTLGIPEAYLRYLRLVAGPERAAEEERQLGQKGVRHSYLWRFAIALIWVGLTAVVFLRANVRLIDFFR